MSFVTERKVRFADEDHARIVYYPRFFHFFHEAFEEMFEAHGVPYRQCLDEGVGWPAVHAEADYKRPVRFGDRLSIAVQVTRLGGTSASFEYVGTVVGENEPAVIGRVVVACIDMTTYRSQPIPEKYRQMFSKLRAPEPPPGVDAS